MAPGQTLQRGTIPSSWGPGYNTLDALLLGLPHVVAPTLGTTIGDPTGRRTDAFNAARNAWSKANPLTAMSTEVAGGLVPTTIAMGLGQEEIAAPLALRLASAVPRLAPALDFLGGSSGAFNAGLVPGLVRTGSLASRGALEGTAGSLLQSGLGGEPTGEQVGVGAATGAVLNPLLGRFAPKTNILPRIASAVQSAIKQGVPIRIGMVPGAAAPLTSLDQLFNMGNNETVRRGFDKALTRWANLPEDRITSDWVDRATSLNGKTMGNIAAKYAVDASDPQVGPKLNSGLARLNAAAKIGLSNEDYAKFKSALLDPVQQNLANGPLPGSIYQRWAGKGGLLETAAKNPGLRPYVSGSADDPNLPLVGMRELLDNAWHDSIAATGNTADYDAFARAKQGYKVAKMIEPGASDATEYNPQKLETALRKRYGSVGRAGALGDLATTGQFIYKGESAPAKASSVLSTAGKHPYVSSGVSAGIGASMLPAIEHFAGSQFTEAPMETALLGGGLATLGLGAGKGTAAALNSQIYTKHLLDIAQGTAEPWLKVNPLIPAAADVLSHRQIGNQ